MAVDRRIPRQEDIYGFILLQIRRLCENTLEILVWIEVVFLSRFDDAESSRACLCARRCIGEEPVFSADDERLDASLSKVVVDLQPAVLNVTAQVRFFLDQIIYCLAKLALRRNVTERFCPRKERVQKRFCLLLSLFQPIFRTLVLHFLFDRVQLTAVIQTDSCRRTLALIFRRS